MSVCVNCNTSFPIQSWLCVNCASDILPFNHISDDSEFLLTIHHYFHLSKNIDVSKIQSLRINPFSINSPNNITLHTNNNFDEINNSEIELNHCQYMFSEDFCAKYAHDQSEFSLFHVNARSLKRNFDQFNALLSSLEFNFSVMAVSETWFDVNTNVNLYNIENYSLVHICRQDKIGGGVALYVKSGFDYILRDDLSCITSNFEMIFIETTHYNKSVVVACIYRPPNTDVKDFNIKMNSILETLSREKKEIYLMGDFNINLLNYGSHNKTNEFLDMMYSFNMYPLISKPTRISANKASLIDNIYSNTLENQGQSGIIYDDLSDHFPIYTVLKNKTCLSNCHQRKRQLKKRFINDDSLLLFKKRLKNVDWSHDDSCTNVNEKYDTFFEKFYDVYDACFPLQTVCDKKMPQLKRPWITKGILKSIRHKNKMYKISLKAPSSQNKLNYKNYKNKLTSIIRYSKYKHYNDIFSSVQGDIKKTWSHINSLLGNKKRNAFPKNMYLDNMKLSSKEDIADQFNHYFVNIGKKLSKSISSPSHSFQDYFSSQNPDSFFAKSTSLHEIIQMSSNIKISKANGPDDISPRVVKECIHYIVNPLRDIFNMSFSTGSVPDQLKTAKIVPLYKKENPECIDNYRPVALLSVFAKLLERLMYNRLYEFLTSKNILIPEQFGFRKNYSTSLSVICFTDYILQEMEKGNICCGVFMDLSKAFDTIDHHILLKKLYLYGIRGLPLQWFRSYLCNRKQYVVVDGVESTHLDVNLGVPQGSVLGPLLFLVYVNDIVKSSDIMKFSLFADDTVVLYSHKNISVLLDTVNKELQMLNEWFKCNKLFLNFKKTKYILFHSKRKHVTSNVIPIRIDNTVIERIESIKFLGIHIHESLDWKYHVANISSKISKGIGVLYKLRHFVPSRILINIYNAIVLPHLNYCNEIWGKTYKLHVDKLYTLQKRAVRLITKSSFRSPSMPLFIKLKIMPVYELIKLNISVFMFKYQKGILPEIFNNMFRINSSFHIYNTRKREDFSVPTIHSTIRSHSICFTGVHEWNSLCNDLKSSSTLSRFRTLLKRSIFEKMSSMTE